MITLITRKNGNQIRETLLDGSSIRLEVVCPACGVLPRNIWNLNVAYAVAEQHICN